MENEKLREMILKHLFIIGGGREVNLEIADKLVDVFQEHFKSSGAKLHVKSSEQTTLSPPFIENHGTDLIKVFEHGVLTEILIKGKGVTSATINRVVIVNSVGLEIADIRVADNGDVCKLSVNGVNYKSKDGLQDFIDWYVDFDKGGLSMPEIIDEYIKIKKLQTQL